MLVKNIKEKIIRKAKRSLALLFGLAFFVGLIFGQINFTQAQVVDTSNSGVDGVQEGLELVGDDVKLADTDIRIFIARIINVILGFLGIILVGLVMYGGWIWMTSEGNPEKINQAKLILKNAGIGLIIILSAFGIATFVFRVLLNGSGGSGGGSGGDPTYDVGVGALGNGIIESHYPERGQTDVARNTMIFITFKEAIDKDSLLTGVSIFKPVDQSSGRENLDTDKKDAKDNGRKVNFTVNASSNNKTFTFTPVDLLGNSSENLWYGVYLSESIEKLSGGSVDLGISDYYQWKFQVGTYIDVTPPKVNSVFPFPDDKADDRQETIRQASGSIVVNSDPQTAKSAIQQPFRDSFQNYTIDGEYQNCVGEGVARFTIGTSGDSQLLSVIKTEQNNFRGFNGASLIIESGEQGIADISCGLRLVFDDYSELSGQAIEINVATARTADRLTIGNQTYVFGSDIEVVLGDDRGTATNIRNKINDDPNSLVTASCNGVSDCKNYTVSLEAKTAGPTGNNIAIRANREGVFEITGMNGGERDVSPTVQGVPDVARNAIIQINFNEAINPLQVNGQASDLQNSINIKDIDFIDGEFKISNNYKTVEFRTNERCGQNSCGDDIYCLPAEKNITALLIAAACTNQSSGVCQSDNPTSPGIMDAAANSLDGNEDGIAEGPSNDNYTWSFWTSDQVDLDSPVIESAQSQANNLVAKNSQAGGIDTKENLNIAFNKLIMSSSLKPGRNYPNDFYNETEKQKEYLAFINFSGVPLGYWIGKTDRDTQPLDSYPDKTTANISHTRLGDSASYGFVIGSGVKDIYQNCYNPAGDNYDSAVSACDPSVMTPGQSCCKGIISTNPTDICYEF